MALMYIHKESFTMSVSFFYKNIFVVGCFIALSCHNSYADGVQDKQTLISVSGSHSITAVNDQATIRGSVITHNIKAKDAVQDNANTIQKIRDTLKQAKFDPKKLLSHNYQLTSNYDYVDNKQVFREYQVTHDISVSTDDINQIGKIADLLTASGVNQISNIEFTSSKATEAYNSALKNAVLDAKHKAELAISGINSLSVGKALSIHINPTTIQPQPVMYQAMVARTMVSKDSAPTHFQTEGQNITVDVQTTWEIINQ